MVKKILFVIDRLSAGAGRVVYDLAKYIDKRKFDVTIARLYPDGDLIHLFDKLGVKIINLNKKTGKDLGLIKRLKKIIQKEKIDIVHTHNVDAYEYGILAAWFAGVEKIIHTAHGKSIKKGFLRKARENIIHRFISHFLDYYVAVSKDLGRYVYRNWCKNKKKIKIIHNGIDIEEYKKKKISKSFLSRFGIKKDDLIVTIVAGLRPVKDHSTLIKAMKTVVKEIPNSKLLLVGDGSEKAKLMQLTKKLGLQKKVIFLGNRKDIVNFLNVTDVGVLCSLDECLSIALLEGMACEVPFVATEVGGNPEVIDHRVNGFLVPSKNQEELASKIIKLLKDKDLREKMGKRARYGLTLGGFRVQTMVKRHEKLYLE